MTDEVFSVLWARALAEGRSAYLKACAEDGVAADDAEEVYEMASLPFREILRRTGLTQKQFSERYCIPRRTVENWAASVTRCPDYVRLLLIRDIAARGRRGDA